ncbi:hypothetical protein, partial [uncultured Desulfobulbus sp.]|uniref:hypothetical protein n=1 Tax=uncultured Desulfobulbus sp. TaxID=239745 RepID=UPI0026131899
ICATVFAMMVFLPVCVQGLAVEVQPVDPDGSTGAEIDGSTAVFPDRPGAGLLQDAVVEPLCNSAAGRRLSPKQLNR